MDLRPLSDYVLCRVLPVSNLSKGGVLLTDGSLGRPDRAEVLKTGTGTMSAVGSRVIPPAVEPGDIVLFDPYKIAWVVGGEIVGTPAAKPGDLFMIRESFIHGVIEED